FAPNSVLPTGLQQPAIPSTRTVAVNEADHMPHDYSTTPGGTLFSTTPGGTRIIYDRKFLLECRSSPLARTPPRGLPTIPGVTMADNLPSKPFDSCAEPDQAFTFKQIIAIA
uniref:Eukaryotic translation initiation factor 4E binding protein 1 n=1 Tax=Nothobranchius furzeri TaxID=105023 RepID=A0A8C6PW31_NOTFU